jgi:mono/diheme cytochrome c family protein
MISFSGRVVFSGFLLLLFLIGGCGDRQWEHTGESLYAEYCQPCHGADGTGSGQLAYLLYPKPRNFTSGLFKLRSTHDGQLPSDDDLFRTIRTGMQGTSMPSFAFLGDESIHSIVEYVKQFDSGFDDEPREKIAVPEPLPFSPRLVAIGEKTYTDLGCHRCHGETGAGDGPSADNLKDAWGYPIYVRDFTRGNYIGGYEPEDLYLRFVSGMSGTPMPSYQSSLGFLAETQEELNDILWGLIYYVKELESEEARSLRASPPEDGIIRSTGIDPGGFDLLDANAPFWNSSVRNNVPVSRVWQNVEDDAAVVYVRTVHTDSSLAMMLEWRDEMKDASAARIQEYQDAAAIQFSLTDQPGFHGMGSRERPVDMWFWRASWQMYVDESVSRDITRVYAGRASDAGVATYPESIRENTFLPGVRAGNFVSRQDIVTPVENANAIGPETVISKPAIDQIVQGKGVWDGEMWRVVFVRDLQTENESSVRFETDTPLWLSLAVWDGDSGDRDGLKKVSTWYRLVLE